MNRELRKQSENIIEIESVCGCTFRLDNPELKDLPFIEYMIEAAVKQIKELAQGK